MAFFAISTVRILSCRTVTENGRRIQQFVGNGKKSFEESLRLKRLGIDKVKDTEIDKMEEQKTDENVQVHSDYEDISDDYLFFDKFLEDKEEKEDKEVIILDGDDETKECDGPEFDDFYGEFCPLYVHRGKRDATNDFLQEFCHQERNSLMETLEDPSPLSLRH